MSDLNESQSELPDARLEAYLDSLMSPAEQRAFETELAGNEQLRRECDLQNQIDVSLGRMFAAPTPPADIAALDDRVSPSEALKQLPVRDQNKIKNRWPTILAILAASIAWVVVGLKVYRASTDDGYRQLALVDIYQKCIADGFQPKWVCDDDQDFAETFQKRQGVPLLLKPDAQEMMVGLSYLKGITSQTTTMLARIDDQPILVFVDSLARDTHPEQPSSGSGLKLFRQELGGLVLYEITPLSEPLVLEHFYIPELTSLPGGDSEKPIGEKQDASKNSL